MREKVISLALAALTLASAASAERNANTYYVQLIRGSDQDKPPVAGSKRVGPKLAGTFHSVFRLRGYWELSRQQVSVASGHRTRVRLNGERSVEIDLTRPAVRRVTAFQNGELVDRVSRPRGEGMTIIGGNRDGKSIWFIVVRRDEPPE